jgi:precorrin-6A synthase
MSRADRGPAVRIRIIGVGMGPHHVTLEAASAIRSCDYVLAAAKSDEDELLEVRRAICAEHGGPELVAVSDPVRDRSPGLTPDGYEGVVGDWHDARAAEYAQVLGKRGGTAGFLVWGDPALYDSTIRVVERVRALGLEVEYDVVPGISALQLLAARHRIVLHEVGQPVHVTTGRRLQEAVAAGLGNIASMLNSSPERLDLTGMEDWTIWWGANLGAAGERLVSGRLGDVLPEIEESRAAAKVDAGWVMDIFLVRAPGAMSQRSAAGAAGTYQANHSEQS